jgi:hypothetical protein
MRGITYDIELKAATTSVQAKTANGIIFKNIGDVDATVNGIPLPIGDTNDDFARNHPGDVILNAFQLAFKTGTLGTNPSVAVIRIMANEISKSEECKFKNTSK